MIQWKIAWREMRSHLGRSLFTLFAVVIGVACVMAVSLATESARRAYREMFRTLSGIAGLEVVSAVGRPLEARILDVIRQTAGVEFAVPLVQRPAIMYHERGRLKLIVLGVDPAQDDSVRDYLVVEGQSLGQAKGVLLDQSMAQSLQLNVGDPVRILTRRGRVHTRIIGLVRPRTGAAVLSSGLLFMPLASAQHYFAIPGRVDRIQVVIGESSSAAQVRDALRRTLPPGVRVDLPGTHSALAEQTMMGMENGLTMATAFSLLSAIFIILNTFLMSVGQRRKQFAVMRAIGALPRQIAGLVLREALILALIGIVCGLILGWAGSLVLNRGMGSLFQTALPPVQLQLGPIALAIWFGLSISLLGALFPARQAARCTPLEGLTNQPRSGEERPRSYLPWLGLVLILLCLAILVGALAGLLPPKLAVVGAVHLLVGLVMLLPLVLAPLTTGVQRLLGTFWNTESRLAKLQVLRHRVRSTLTIGVLFVALATGVGLASSVLENVADVRAWYRTIVRGDLFIRAAMPDMSTAMSVAIPDRLGDELRQIPGVARLGSVKLVNVTVEGVQAIVIVTGSILSTMDSSQRLVLPFSPPDGDEVLIGTVLAQRLKRKAGEMLVLETLQGPRPVRIQKVYNDYSVGGLSIHMNRDLAEQLLGVEGVDAFLIKADPAQLSAVEKSVREICSREGLLLQSYTDLTQMIEEMMSGLVASLWGLMFLGLIVAAVGVVNTLSMNVLEQGREWGLLRVVGMTRAQVRRTILSQGLILGILGLGAGVVAGLALAYIINLTTLPVIGHPIAFRFPGLLLIAAFTVALILVLLAAWAPAERAARLVPAEALRYD